MHPVFSKAAKQKGNKIATYLPKSLKEKQCQG